MVEIRQEAFGHRRRAGTTDLHMRGRRQGADPRHAHAGRASPRWCPFRLLSPPAILEGGGPGPGPGRNGSPDAGSRWSPPRRRAPDLHAHRGHLLAGEPKRTHGAAPTRRSRGRGEVPGPRREVRRAPRDALQQLLRTAHRHRSHGCIQLEDAEHADHLDPELAAPDAARVAEAVGGERSRAVNSARPVAVVLVLRHRVRGLRRYPALHRGRTRDFDAQASERLEQLVPTRIRRLRPQDRGGGGLRHPRRRGPTHLLSAITDGPGKVWEVVEVTPHSTPVPARPEQTVYRARRAKGTPDLRAGPRSRRACGRLPDGYARPGRSRPPRRRQRGQVAPAEVPGIAGACHPRAAQGGAQERPSSTTTSSVAFCGRNHFSDSSTRPVQHRVTGPGPTREGADSGAVPMGKAREDQVAERDHPEGKGGEPRLVEAIEETPSQEAMPYVTAVGTEKKAPTFPSPRSVANPWTRWYRLLQFAKSAAASAAPGRGGRSRAGPEIREGGQVGRAARALGGRIDPACGAPAPAPPRQQGEPGRAWRSSRP